MFNLHVINGHGRDHGRGRDKVEDSEKTSKKMSQMKIKDLFDKAKA